MPWLDMILRKAAANQTRAGRCERGGLGREWLCVSLIGVFDRREFISKDLIGKSCRLLMATVCVPRKCKGGRIEALLKDS